MGDANICAPNSTSKERDVETGLDYFGARYYSGAQGRFTSPDPGPYDLKNPQSLNRYSYVINNPLKFIDPFGEMAKFAVDEVNKTITVTVDIELWGPDATEELADTLKSEIEKTLQGKYTDPKTGVEYSLTTTANVTVADSKNASGSPVPNQIYVDFSRNGVNDISNFSRLNRGNRKYPRYIGAFYADCRSPQCREHESGHFIGLGDDYFARTGKPVPEHKGHLMAGGDSDRLAQDEVDRFAKHVLSTGKSTGTVIWLPDSKTSYDRDWEKNPK